MIELPPDRYDVARALFAEYVHGKGSIGSVFEGRQPAKLLVDSTSNPAVALLLRPPRHAFLAGDPSCEAVWHYMADLSPRKLFARDQLILSMPNDSWRYPIKSVLGEGLTEESRVSFGFIALPPAPLAAREDLPVATRVTAELLQHEMLDGVLRNWQTVEQFETRGLGYCILGPRGDVVSACYSVTSGEDTAPIQVMTASEHQRKGFATIVARALIEEATQRKITPSWECDIHNEASIALAEKLGFERQSEYSRFWYAP